MTYRQLAHHVLDMNEDSLDSSVSAILLPIATILTNEKFHSVVGIRRTQEIKDNSLDHYHPYLIISK